MTRTEKAKPAKRPAAHEEGEICPVNFNATVKSFDDRLLTTLYEDLDIRDEIVNCLKNHFNLFHATPAQVASICTFSADRSSILLQSHTGTGKTLAFLVSLAERLLRVHQSFENVHSMPYRTTDIHAIIVSPHQALSNQTFLQCTRLFSHLPHNVKVVSDVDCYLSERTRIQNERQSVVKSCRFYGGGVILVLTPPQFRRLVAHVTESNASDLPFARPMSASAPSDERSSAPKLAPLVLIVDEVDLVLQKHKQFEQNITTLQNAVKAQRSDSNEPSPFDFGFFGATAASSSVVDSCVKQLNPKQSIVRFQVDELDDKEILQDTNVRRADGQPIHVRLQGLLPTMRCTMTSPRDAEVVDDPCQWYSFTFGDQEMATARLRNLFVRTRKDSLMRHVSCLVHLLNAHETKKHLIFFNDFRMAREVHDKLGLLHEKRILSDSMENIHLFHEHLPVSQQRNSYLSFVKKKETSEQRTILLCTDQLAYGIDIRDVEYVIHFDPPKSVQSYFHRVGRTGRMGTKGTSVVLIDEEVDGDIFKRMNETLTLTEWKVHNPIQIYL